jgi:hypothetical protein
MSVFLSFWLIACANSTSGTIDIGDPPAGLVTCTIETVPEIPGEPGTALSKAQAAKAIGEQRTSALAKDKCSLDWQAHYKDLRDALRLMSTTSK